VDGDVQDTQTSSAVPNTSEDWMLLTDSTLAPYANSFSIETDGTEVLHYEPDEIIHEGTLGELTGGYLPDLSGYGHDGLIVWGTNEGVSATAGAFLPGNTAKYLGYNGGSGDSGLGIPTMPQTMYTEGDTSKFPFGKAIDQILDAGNIPHALWWYPFIFIGASIIGMLIYEATTLGGGEGSLLLMCIVMEVCFVLFGVMGSVTDGVKGSLIPLFGAFLFPIPCSAFILSRRHTGWG
jgi:hypothetical protein